MIFFPFTKKTKDQFKIVTTSNYGSRYISGKWGFHRGIDYAPQVNLAGDTEVIASQFGTLRCWKDQFGALVADINGKDGKRYRYIHLSKFLKPDGNVMAGDVIGYTGSTGNSTGEHLHFEVWNDYKRPSTHINPNSLNLKYYDTEMEESREEKLQDAIAFNNKYTDIPNRLKLIPFDLRKGKLMNVMDTTKKEDALIITMEYLNKMKAIGYTNTAEFDALVVKLAYLVNAKLDY